MMNHGLPRGPKEQGLGHIRGGRAARPCYVRRRRVSLGVGGRRRLARPEGDVRKRSSRHVEKTPIFIQRSLLFRAPWPLARWSRPRFAESARNLGPPLHLPVARLFLRSLRL